LTPDWPAVVLIYSGVLERRPNLRIVLYHAGRALPSMLGRLDMGFERIPDCRSAIPRPPSSYVNQFCFDTIAFNPPMLRYLADTYGAERLVIGTDYPLPAGIAHPVAEVKALGLPSGVESAILSGHARRLLRLD
jgi:aminocarboxymuconate-semialdehyde decarboxylase